MQPILKALAISFATGFQIALFTMREGLLGATFLMALVDHLKPAISFNASSFSPFDSCEIANFGEALSRKEPAGSRLHSPDRGKCIFVIG